MKFVKGRTLKEIIAGIRKNDAAIVAEYPLNRLLNIFQRVCDAMAFAHSRHVIHRDLKPENVMVGNYGEVLVMDWGLAKILNRADAEPAAPVPGGDQTPDADARPDWITEDVDSLRHAAAGYQTMAGTVMGTPAFMAPEQAMGKAVDARSDAYALGAMLYNILSLHAPVTGRSVNRILMKVVKGTIRPVLDWNAISERDAKVTGRELLKRKPGSLTVLRHCPDQHIPDSLGAVTMKALALAPEDRYQTVKDLQAEVEAYQGGFATGAEDAGLLRQLRLLVGRHKGACAGVAAALVVIAAVVAVAFANVSREKRAALAEKSRAEGEKAKAEAAVVQMQQAEAEKRAQGRQTAPTFAQAAEQQILTEQWSLAEASAHMAVELDPELATGWLQQGRLLVAAGDVIRAETAFRRARDLAENGSETRRVAGHYLMICIKLTPVAERHGGELPDSDQHALAQRLEKVGDRAMAARLLARVGKPDEALRLRLAAAMAAVAKANPGFHAPPVELKEGKVIWNLPQAGASAGKEKLTDLSALRGLPLTHVDLAGTGVADLSALQGMPLQSLSLQFTKVTDLSPLRGAPLRRLWAAASSGHGPFIKDLAPLRGMPLETLHINAPQATDLEPLRGMPLTELGVLSERLTDIGALRGMPLTRLGIQSGARVDIGPLRGLRLEHLSLKTRTAPDLSSLRGMPLTELKLHPAPNDLAALQGMPLRFVQLINGAYTDLSPLAQMPLQQVTLQHCSVSDLRPLAGLPRERVTLGLMSATPVDLSPLAKCRQLRTLTASHRDRESRMITGVESLRNHPTLRFLDIRTDGVSASDRKPVAQFWTEYDAAHAAPGAR
jgi:tetratricopeptide (TPR) repeat protein